MVTDVKFQSLETNGPIVTMAMAKKQLRVEASFNDEDDLIQSYIDTAVAMSEDYMGGHIVEKNMIMKMNMFDNPLIFEAFPIQSVVSVSYFSSDGSDSQEMTSFDYDLTSVNPKVSRITFKNIPQTAERFDAVTITVKVGIEATKVVKPIIQAVLLQVADMYERREDRTEVMLSVSTALLRPYKKF
ncbi:hypothetical protein B0A75_04700 [Flavobacterium oncorhynchi]|uniref:Phage gp6-like head-tail connector protein n=1 Tax=Flavobacterium oncorhynchi TaxID=728056 RepID=A0A226I4P1_9FLAO|nr:head-tail connector protein [Flavobacterium oncorhynchi]OXB01744.1 hypothetical protein B0A75_04700 [Flavobacterium oncorhynchi]